MGNNKELKVELSAVFLLKSLFLCVKHIYKPFILMCRCQEFACVTALNNLTHLTTYTVTRQSHSHLFSSSFC